MSFIESIANDEHLAPLLATYLAANSFFTDDLNNLVPRVDECDRNLFFNTRKLSSKIELLIYRAVDGKPINVLLFSDYIKRYWLSLRYFYMSVGEEVYKRRVDNILCYANSLDLSDFN